MKLETGAQRITMTAASAAVIFVVTFMIRIPVPGGGGYLNIGDAPVYLAAYLLGGPYGAVAAAVGSALSDLSGGFVVYMIPTALIKGAMGLICGRIASGGTLRRFVFVTIVCALLMTGGYALFEALFFNVNQALVGIPFNLAQGAAGVIVAAAIFPAVRKLSLTTYPHRPTRRDGNNR
ncbi:MAG: ECF transporter S component [Clostridiales bacterium]|nr:ECF transporter S component [Clostridiales bacterium]